MKRIIFTLIMIILVPFVIALAESNTCNPEDKACNKHKGDPTVTAAEAGAGTGQCETCEKNLPNSTLGGVGGHAPNNMGTALPGSGGPGRGEGSATTH